MPPPRRHFLPWDRPLLPQAAAWLAGGWDGGAPLDLSRTLVIVPTKQSGRRLREALAEFAAARGQAAFPPRVVAPNTLVALGLGEDTAPPLESLLAWAEVLRGLEREEFGSVFPAGVPEDDAAWALQMAQQFLRLQAELAEGGLRLGDVAARAGADFPELARWGELAELEARYDEALAEHGLHDAQAAKIAAVQAGGATEDFDRVVVIGTPDPLPLAIAALLAQEKAIDVVIFAPETETESFDAWGRPVPEVWARREITLADFERRVRLCADPAGQAARAAAIARSYAAPDGLVALGVADAEIGPLLHGELSCAGVAVFNPEGQPQRGEQLWHLLAALAALAREPDFAAIEALARCPDFLHWLRARCGAGFSPATFLKRLDDLRADHLPADLEEARRHNDSPELARIADLRRLLTTGEFPHNAVVALAEIFATRKLDLVRDVDARLGESARAWTEVLQACAAARERFPALGDTEWWELALRIFGDATRAVEKPADALELQGWLELLYEDAPHLVVAGLNDGRVPDAVAGDAFLPESLRTRLGLKTNAARFARDAYLLQAVAACRAGGAGRIDLLFGKTSVAGDPLRPSRLLLQCADAALPARVAFLFREPELAAANPAWSRAWQLAPRRAEPPAKVSVTSLRGWLTCPFRFYLRTVLRMEAVDPAKSELDAMDFGTLCHAALEAMGKDEAMRHCTDAETLREFLLAKLDRAVRRRFGENLTLPLVIQVASARQRLAQVAVVQARERAAGWVIEQVEQGFETEIAGLVIRGKIDRVDRHVETGAIRLLDYKTSDTAVSPAQAHLRSVHNDETPPPWVLVETDGKLKAWSDLQLPLYRHALAAQFSGEVTCGYFNLPKAVGDTGLSLWTDYTRDLHERAMAAAEGVCAAIRAGEFWPPNPHIDERTDEFAELFHRGAAESVAWTGVATGGAGAS